LSTLHIILKEEHIENTVNRILGLEWNQASNCGGASRLRSREFIFYIAQPVGIDKFMILSNKDKISLILM
jgi:hypothetical protein